MSNDWEILQHNQRSAPRYQSRLQTSISLITNEDGLGHTERPPVIPGQTRDISVNGLAIVVPSLRTSNHDLTRLECAWRVVLATPNGYVLAETQLVHYGRYRGEGPLMGYLIGMRISGMSEVDRPLYNGYLRSLEEAMSTIN